MRPDGVVTFAGDLSEQEQKMVWATHIAPAADLFDQKVEGTALRSKPSWYIVATKDRTVQPASARQTDPAHQIGETRVGAQRIEAGPDKHTGVEPFFGPSL